MTCRNDCLHREVCCHLLDGEMDEDYEAENCPQFISVAVNDKVLLPLLKGEWVDCDAVQKALNISFGDGLKIFDFSREVEWWSLIGKTPEERKRNGQKISTFFRVKRGNDNG